MTAQLPTFEVRVKVKGLRPKEYRSDKACFVYDEAIKMYHEVARTAKQAMDKCRKFGQPLSARKVNVYAMHKNFEHLIVTDKVYKDGSEIYKEGDNIYKKGEDIYKEGNPYNSAIAMDEMIWQKHNKRRNNMHKDKENH